jgi:hypothetical protein
MTAEFYRENDRLLYVEIGRIIKGSLRKVLDVTDIHFPAAHKDEKCPLLGNILPRYIASCQDYSFLKQANPLIRTKSDHQQHQVVMRGRPAFSISRRLSGSFRSRRGIDGIFLVIITWG